MLGQLLVEAAARETQIATVRSLAELIGLGVRTFQSRCKSAGTSGKAFLDFTRCLRIVLCTEFWDPVAAIAAHYRDGRTIARVEQRGYLFQNSKRPEALTFIQCQQFIQAEAILRDARLAIVALGLRTPSPDKAHLETNQTARSARTIRSQC